MVSNPGVSLALSRSGDVALTVAGNATTAYVSLPPGAFADGLRATVRHARTGASATTAMVDGGFDPLPIEAAEGDALVLEIEHTDASLHRFSLKVPSRRRPVVVRTEPRGGKRDVPLNAMIRMVFSEPVDSRTVTAGSVRLESGSTTIPARLEFQDPGHLVLGLIPDEPLQGSTAYELVLSDAIRDFDGDSLEAGVTVGFETASSGSGSIRVTAATTGTDIDVDGYTIWMARDGSSRAIATNGSATLPPLPPGDHEVMLTGVAQNCTVSSPNPVAVRVEANQTSNLSFAVTCVPPVDPTGSIRVTTVTTGSDIDPDGYWVAGQFMGDRRNPLIGPNATVTVSDLPAGQQYVWLIGVAENCTVSGERERLVTVAPGGVGTVTFTLDCVPTTALRITVNTSGVDLDPDGYTALVQRPGLDRRVDVPANGSTTTASLVFGEILVTLVGVSANCDVSGPHPRVVVVPSGGTVETTFSVTCAPATLIAYAIAPESSPESSDIHVVRSNGQDDVRLTTHPAADAEPDWSPDGTRIVFRSDRDGNREIYVMGADGSAQTRLTNHPAHDYDPAWSPDGSRIAFVSERDGNPEIYVMNADGTNPVRLTTSDGPNVGPAWSPDGRRIAFRSERVEYGPGNGEIEAINADGTNLIRLTNDGADDAGPAWSPDGTRIAFSRFIACQDQFGDYEILCQSDIFTMNTDGSGVTRVGGIERFFMWDYYADDEKSPAWSPDGRKIAISATTCVSDGHCHLSSEVTVFTIGVPGVSMLARGAAIPMSPAWRR